MTKRVIVIGSGIIGASIAWHLARAGAAVTVIEAGDAGGLATRNSWAWINASWGNPLSYFRLRVRSMEEWRRLDREVPGLAVNWCGGLIWDLPPVELDAFAREHAGWGYGIRRVGPDEMRRIEPGLKIVPDHAYHVAAEGAVEPAETARLLLSGARALGAEVLDHSHVRWLVEEANRVVGIMTDEGIIHADEVVVAAGGGSQQLLDSVGIAIRLTAPPGLLSHSKPAPELLRGLLMTPGLHVRQTREGRLVAGTDFAGADPMGKADELAHQLHGKVQALVAGAEQIALDFHTVGYRPTPADGFPAIGRPRNREGLYVAVTHSGVTLAPAIGLFASTELMDGRRDPLLDPFHPDRPALQ
ncbi:MAG: FAD-binding oxidoreductase [Alphaproteobacteria bacterium]|nr:FAD-binding oxidoreductase [Alphaproteobacteria bacterium]